MKIYIGGKWDEKDKIAKYAKLLTARRHEITEPWFLCTGHEPIDIAAEKDMQGVLKADTCIFIFENDLPYSGAVTEMGMAIATGCRTIIVGHGADKNIFTHLRWIIRVETFDEVLEII